MSDSKYFRVSSQMVSVTITELCDYDGKRTIDEVSVKGQGISSQRSLWGWSLLPSDQERFFYALGVCRRPPEEVTCFPLLGQSFLLFPFLFFFLLLSCLHAFLPACLPAFFPRLTPSPLPPSFLTPSVPSFPSVISLNSGPFTC